MLLKSLQPCNPFFTFVAPLNRILSAGVGVSNVIIFLVRSTNSCPDLMLARVFGSIRKEHEP